MGYDNVIIINAKDAVYGFPSKIEDDPVMKLVIKKSDEMDYAELTSLAEEIFNASLPQCENDYSINKILSEYENSVFNNSNYVG